LKTVTHSAVPQLSGKEEAHIEAIRDGVQQMPLPDLAPATPVQARLDRRHPEDRRHVRLRLDAITSPRPEHPS
jgi:hypothetical protein